MVASMIVPVVMLERPGNEVQVHRGRRQASDTVDVPPASARNVQAVSFVARGRFLERPGGSAIDARTTCTSDMPSVREAAASTACFGRLKTIALLKINSQHTCNLPPVGGPFPGCGPSLNLVRTRICASRRLSRDPVLRRTENESACLLWFRPKPFTDRKINETGENLSRGVRSAAC